MKLIEYFNNATTEEITERLKYLDKAIYELHTIKDEKAPDGRYVIGDLSEIEVIDGDITIDSFHDKYDYINSGFHNNPKTDNIVQLCAIGICAYCRLQKLYTTPAFIEDLRKNLDMYLERSSMPSEMQQYYIEVFDEAKISYLNSFLSRKLEEAKSNSESQSNSRGAYVKKNDFRINIDDDSKYSNLILPYLGNTGVSRTLLSFEKAAYASVLLLPALLALIYILTVVVYFVFIK